jgi:hypothetical protein
VDFDLAIVSNQAQFSKFVHEKAYAGARRTNHLRERFLADLGDDWLGSTVLTKIREKHQEGPRQPLLAGVEQLVDQVRFNPVGISARRPQVVCFDQTFPGKGTGLFITETASSLRDAFALPLVLFGRCL